jgi:hypothetical protein
LPRQSKVAVLEFSKKLTWCFENLVPQRVRPSERGEPHSQRGRLQEITNLSKLWMRMDGDHPGQMPTRERWLQDVRENRAGLTILQHICAIYPELDIELLTDTDFAEFRRRAGHLVEARDGYIELGRDFLLRRDALARFSKGYYRSVDETPDWPLVARRSWRLARPIELSERSALDRFLPSATFPAARPLPGLNAKYSQIRRMLAPESILPFNGECYRLAELDFEDPGRPCFTYGSCCYFDYYDTCEVHALKMAALESGVPPPPAPDLLDFTAKASVPGVNTLTVFRNFRLAGQRPGDYFLLHRRSSKTVQAGRTIHVVPSGQHQPSQAHYGRDEDVSIWRTMVREFCEEIYGVPEAHGLRTAAGDQLDSPSFRKIVDPIFRSGAARSYLLGVGVDPVTGKAEILAVTIIDFAALDPASADHLSRPSPNWEGDIGYFALTKTQIRTQLDLDRTYDLKWLPAGKACLEEFLRHFDALVGPHVRAG